MKRDFLWVWLVGVFLLFGPPVNADDLSWNVNIPNGNWNDPSNWTSNRVPTASDSAVLHTNDSNIAVNYNSDNPAINTFSIAAPRGESSSYAGTMTLNLIAGTLRVIGDPTAAGGNQSSLGGNGRGVINQSGGSLIISGTDVNGAANGSLILGADTVGVGTYNLSGAGNLSINRFEIIGNLGTGVFNQIAGTHSVGTDLTVGRYGTGVFNQTGGTSTIGGTLYISRYAGSTGIYNLNGGNLYANGGIVNNGTFIQTNGQNLQSRGFSTGLSNSGTFNLTSGSLTLSPINNATNGGLSNSGTFNLTSGSLTLGNNANVTNTNTFNITGLGNSGGVLQSGGWGNLYNSIQTNQTPIQQLSYTTPATSVTGTIANSGSWNVTNTLVSYSASQIPTASGPQVSLDYQLKSLFINSGGYRSDPSTSIFSNLINPANGYIQGSAGDEFLVLGYFENQSTQAGLWNTDNALLGFVGTTGTEHDYILSGLSPSFEWGSLYLAQGNSLDIQSTPSTGLYFERIILEDVAQLSQITSNTDIYYTSIVDLPGNLLDTSGYSIQGQGRLINAIQFLNRPPSCSLALVC